jgi:phage/plasmid-like protein (TIGR03299 family)
MSHELDDTTGRYAIAYGGETPWHKHGQPLTLGMTLDQCIDAGCVGYEVIRVPAYAPGLDGAVREVENAFFNMRSDTGAILGTQTHTDRRVEVQPREIFKFVHDYVANDSRFKFEVIGAIRKGAQVWATASYNGIQQIAGQSHKSYLLARTGFDGSLATHLYMTTVCAVCANTLAMGWDKRAMVTVRHTTKFDSAVAARQLAAMAQAVESYKAIGDALAQANFAADATADFFKDMLAIPRDAKPDDISTRKQNQYADLARCYRTSVAEGCPQDSAWAALQAVTRYADHDRPTRGGNGNEDAARFDSSQFGSGALMKDKAMGLLLPLIRDKVPIAA